MYKRRVIAFMLCVFLTIGLINSSTVTEAKNAVKLKKSAITVTVGASKNIKIVNVKKKKKVKWAVVSGITNVVGIKKSKCVFRVTGKIAGTAIVRATVGKKVYDCRITIINKAKAATFTEASWSKKRPASGTTSSSNDSSSGKNRSGIDDIIYYDLNYTDADNNLITTASVPSSKTTTEKNSNTTEADGKKTTTEKASDSSEDIDDPIYDDEDEDIYYYDEEEDAENEVDNTDGKNADDVAALINIADVQAANGVIISRDLDSEIYNWEELDEGSGVERIVGINFSGLGVSGELNIDAYISDIELYRSVDKNKPGLSQLKEINVSDTKISSLNCSKCVNIEAINISSTNISNLNVSSMTALKELIANNSTSLESVSIQSCRDLETVDISESEVIKKVSITGCASLSEVILSGCETLTSLDLSSDTSLGELVVNDTSLSSLKLNGCTGLYYLNCSSNQLAGGLDLTTCKSLEEIDCSYNQLTSVKPYNNSDSPLVILNCSNNSIAGFGNALNRCVELSVVNASYNRMGSSATMNLAAAMNISEIDISNNLGITRDNIAFYSDLKYSDEITVIVDGEEEE